jgi:hypothetical protein
VDDHQSRDGGELREEPGPSCVSRKDQHYPRADRDYCGGRNNRVIGETCEAVRVNELRMRAPVRVDKKAGQPQQSARPNGECWNMQELQPDFEH